ncbi:MAG: EamA family transporter [Candidatus Dojkabacteria bacterium]
MGIIIIGAILSAVGFGIANVVIKKLLGNTSIPQTIIMSFGFGALFLLILNFIQGFPEYNYAVSLLPTLALFSFGEVALYLVLYKAFDAANVTLASGILSAYPVLSTFFAVIFLHETVLPVKILFIILMVVGAIILVIDWNEVRKNGFDKKDLIKGLPWVLLCLLLHAIYFPALGNLTADGFWEFKLLGIKIFAFLILIVYFFVIQKNTVQGGKSRIGLGISLGLLEVLGWIGLSWASGNTVGQIAIIVAVGSSAPLVTAIVARVFLKEKLSWIQYFGVFLIFICLTAIALI